MLDLSEEKKKAYDKMELHSILVKEDLYEEKADINCDYVVTNRLLSHYYRGAYNQLIELERKYKHVGNK